MNDRITTFRAEHNVEIEVGIGSGHYSLQREITSPLPGLDVNHTISGVETPGYDTLHLRCMDLEPCAITFYISGFMALTKPHSKDILPLLIRYVKT